MTTLNSINKKLKEYNFDLKLVEYTSQEKNPKMKVFCLEGDPAQYDETGDLGIFEIKSIKYLDVGKVLNNAEALTLYHERYVELNSNTSLDKQINFTTIMVDKYKTKHTNHYEQLDYLEEVVTGLNIVDSLKKVKELEQKVEKQKKKIKKLSAQVKELQAKKPQT